MENSPNGRVLKSDTKVAKNYLDKDQIRKLERNVSSYLDYVEDLTERHNTFTMQEFSDSIDRFLSFREYAVLPDNGSVSMKNAKNKASKEYDEFNKTQKITSDFDKQVKNIIDQEHE